MTSRLSLFPRRARRSQKGEEARGDLSPVALRWSTVTLSWWTSTTGSGWGGQEGGVGVRSERGLPIPPAALHQPSSGLQAGKSGREKKELKATVTSHLLL